jgi:hypothetical protein
MDAFSLLPPEWTQSAVHAVAFCCPQCHKSCKEAEQVWINRRSPVYTADHRRKWQEFYRCSCGCVWWAWSSDRPANELGDRNSPAEDYPWFNPFDEF